MTVALVDDEPTGLATIVGDLIEQNLKRDPARLRLLRPTVASIAATEAEVSITIAIAPGRVVISGGRSASAHVAITADPHRLMELIAAPLRFGLPDVLDPRGRAVLAGVATRRVRIRGLLRHPRRVARLSALLSVA